MNIILAEESKYPIGSFVDKVKSQFPTSSTVSLNRNNVQEVKKQVKVTPVMSEGWLVLINLPDVTGTLVRELDIPDNVNVYIVRNKDKMAEVSRVFFEEKVKFSVVDNLNPSKEEINLYVMESLGISKELALHICKRHKYFLPKVAESVDILKGVESITKDTINKYTQKSGDVSFNSLFYYIIGFGDKLPRHSQIVKLVYKYRYGFDFLMKFINKRFSSYLYIFDKIAEGSLSLENYLDYYETHKSDFKDVTPYELKNAIESYGVVSYDKLYYLSVMYQRDSERGTTVVSLLNLLRLSRL